MRVYTIYNFGEKERIRCIGFPPVKRKNPGRITQESILNYVRTIPGHEANDNKIYCFQVTLDERMGEILLPKLSIGTQGTA